MNPKSTGTMSPSVVSSPTKEKEMFPPIFEEKNIKTLKNDKPPELHVRRMSSMHNLMRRRSSAALMSPTSPNIPKPTFKSIGGKVTTMLRAKMAFQRKHSVSAEPEDSEITVIREMPKTPRFSSSLSPEAQFAMMKGYEDTVYGYLCSSFPESKNILKRTRTPVSQIDIKDVPRSVQTPRHQLKTPESTRSSSPGSDLDSSSRPGSVFNFGASDVGRSSRLSRTTSMPVLVPLHKQLVLTYRLQSAMDILDTVRGSMGMHAISPRIKDNRTDVNPVKDYNSWTRVWNTEFQVNKAKTKA